MDSTDQEADQQDAYVQRANFYNEIIGAEVYEYIPFSDVIRNSVIVLLVIIGAVGLLFLFIPACAWVTTTLST